MGGRPLEEAELVERARDGDVEAYGELVRAYQGLAGRVAYVVSGSASDAEDAVQEAFVKAYGALNRFRAGAAFRPWLMRIVANEAINRRRSVRRHATLTARAAEGRPVEDAVPSPEGAALAQETRRELLLAVNRLRPEDRLVIAYRYWFDLAEAEMAEAMGCRPGTVKSRLSRALQRLRRELPASVVPSAAEESEVVDG